MNDYKKPDWGRSKAGVLQIVGIVGAKALRQENKDGLEIAGRCVWLVLEGIRREQGQAEMDREAELARFHRAWDPDWLSTYQMAVRPVLSKEPYTLIDFKIPLEAVKTLLRHGKRQRDSQWGLCSRIGQ